MLFIKKKEYRFLFIGVWPVMIVLVELLEWVIDKVVIVEIILSQVNPT